MMDSKESVQFDQEPSGPLSDLSMETMSSLSEFRQDDEKRSITTSLARNKPQSPRARSSSDATSDVRAVVATSASKAKKRALAADGRALRGPRAEDIPRWKRILQVVAAVSSCLLSAGIVCGYAALKPVLKSQGAYQLACGGSLRTSPVSAAVDACVDLKLDFMFSVATVGSGVATLPGGAILDRYGPRACAVSGGVLLSAGALLMAFASGGSLPPNALVAGYLLLALGGSFVMLSSYQLSNAFPQHSGFILALSNSAYDASSVLFLVYQLAYNASAAAFTPTRFFLAYLAVPAGIIALQFTLQPRYSYITADKTPRNGDADADAVDGPGRDEEETGRILSSSGDGGPVRDRSGIWGAMHGVTFWRQIASPWWLLMSGFAVVQMTRLNFFIATIGPQADYLLSGGESSQKLNNFFDAALPAGGVAAAPAVGYLLDRLSAPWALGGIVGGAALIGALGAVPFTPAAAYTGISLFVLYRPFFYTALADYCAKVFGFRNFGTVYGTLFLVGGLANFIQAALDDLFRRVCSGNPIPVNLLLLGLAAVLGVPWVAFILCRARHPGAETSSWSQWFRWFPWPGCGSRRS